MIFTVNVSHSSWILKIQKFTWFNTKRCFKLCKLFSNSIVLAKHVQAFIKQPPIQRNPIFLKIYQESEKSCWKFLISIDRSKCDSVDFTTEYPCIGLNMWAKTHQNFKISHLKSWFFIHVTSIMFPPFFPTINLILIFSTSSSSSFSSLVVPVSRLQSIILHVMLH